MNIDFSEFEQRKKDHIELALDPIHQTSGFNSFDKYSFVHEAIPDLNFMDVQIFVQSKFSNWTKPFFISSMTAGHEHAVTINRNLLAACKVRQWAMGVGSQRREIDDSNAYQEWTKLRHDYADVVMMANIGLAQLITTPLDMLKRLVNAIEAKLFIIHCNNIQYVILP
jgi:isopentenyl-diphosphate delta-isomerase